MTTKSPLLAFVSRHRALVVVLAIALCTRLLFLLIQWHADPLLFVPSVDEQTYFEDASRWVESGFAPSGLRLPFWQPPGYMFVLSLWIAIGGGVAGFIVLQMLLGIANSGLMYALVVRLFGETARRSAFIAACAYNFFPAILYYETKLLKPTLVIFLMLSLLFLALPRARWWLMKGLLSGAMILFDLYFLVLPLALIWRADWRPRNAVRLLAGILVIVAPVTWLNTKHGGEFIPVSYNGPINLFIGNNPDWLTTYNTLPGLPWYKITLMHEQEAKQDPESARYGKLFLEDVRDYVVTRPMAMLEGLGTKALLFFSAREMPRNGAFLMPMPVKWFGGIANALLLAAALLAIPKLRREPLILIPILAIFAVNVVFFPTSRYRLPAIPLALIATGIFAIEPVRWVKRTLTFAVILSAAATVLAFRVIKYDEWKAFSYNEAAWAEIDVGHEAHATQMVAKALSNSRSSAALDTAGQLAITHEKNGVKAAALFDEAIAASPENPTPHFNRGRISQMQGQFEEAYRHFDDYLRLVRPDLPNFSEKDVRSCAMALEVTAKVDFEQGRLRMCRERLANLQKLLGLYPVEGIRAEGLVMQIAMIDQRLTEEGPVR